MTSDRRKLAEHWLNYKPRISYVYELARSLLAAERELEQLREKLDAAVLLHIPGKWGREHGYDIPSGEIYEWDAARIRLFRSLGMDELAEHLTKDRLGLLEARDWSDGTTSRADAFRAALAGRELSEWGYQ